MGKKESNIKKENIKVLMADSGTRGRVFLTGFILVAIIVVAALFLFSGDNTTPVTESNVTSLPDVKSIPGTSASERYNDLVKEKNQANFLDAANSGASALPILTGNGALEAPPPEKPPEEAKPDDKPPEVITKIVYRTKKVKVPVIKAPPKDRVKALEAAKKSAKRQVEMYMKSFLAAKPSSEFSYYGVAKEKQRPSPAQASSRQIASQSPTSYRRTNTNPVPVISSRPASSQQSGPTFVRAGTIIPAILMTPVNSDAQGPVLAKITTGPLAGARVLGGFEVQRGRIVLTFDKISKPGFPQTFSIDAYAVSQATNAPGLQSDVNHHFFEKYGLLVAASFMQGYGEAIQNAGTTITFDTGTETTTVVKDGTDERILKSALGEVGRSLGEVAKQNAAAVRPTYTLEKGANGRGMSIGLLFMSDF